MKNLYERVHVGDIKPGDTVLIDGEFRTVCLSDLGGDTFRGPSLFGDSYRCGKNPVTRVTFGAELPRQSKGFKA